MGTSSRRVIPRVKDKIKDLDPNADFDRKKLKEVIKDLLYPNGRKSYNSEHIIRSLSSPNFVRTIRKLIRTSENYISTGNLSFGIENFESYGFIEKVDLIADFLVDYENPILKQTIKDILLDNGIEETFSNAFAMLKKVISIYIEKYIQGPIFEMISEKYENISDEKIYQMITEITTTITETMISFNAYNSLAANISNESYVEDWLTENIPHILKGVAA